MTRSAREALASALKSDEQNLYKGFEEWADLILSRLAEEGWVVVPREPTKEMLEAGAGEVTGDDYMAGDSWHEEAATVYSAMLAAAIEEKGKG